MNTVKVLKTELDYTTALSRTIEIFHAEEGTPEADELELLLLLVSDYENRNVKLPELNPIELIKLKMEEQGLKSKDLESIIGSKGHVSSILSGRRELTLKMAQKLVRYFHLPADIFLPA
ncbi:helix-turn-helix domain-containing protein [Pedobacter sp. MC2016-05]|uniref:helix-turn-helix domain-containing protein n=1 Tax=Pedobacter sp. MC2016-05 TaxID=2994474 RepID=UPI00224534BA|nr:helix-turn-helix domain-containing protein [Pedobacter sp. MC2016-05]MCX2474373.1 helix-turn-helix domain-containing protein [Pedobacter sp. MC2016-05]